jgi:hypothetical protein
LPRVRDIEWSRDAARGWRTLDPARIIRRVFHARRLVTFLNADSLRAVLRRSAKGQAGFVMVIALMLACSDVHGQANDPARGDRLDGVILPIEPLDGEISIEALRAWTWTAGATRRLLVEGDVQIEIAGHSFTATAATAWIHTLRSDDGGPPVHQIAVFFEELRNGARPAGPRVSGRDLLVTGSVRGPVTMRVALRQPGPPPAERDLVARGEVRLAEHLRRLHQPPPSPPPPVPPPPPAAPPLPVHPSPEEPERIDPPAPPRRAPTVAPPDRPRAPWQPHDLDAIDPFPAPADPTHIPLEDFEPQPQPTLEPPPWLAIPGSSVQFAARDVRVESGEDENVITLIGPLVIEHLAADTPGGPLRPRLTLTAQRGVMFTDPGPLMDMAAGELSVESIRGVYLEGNVIVRAGQDEYMLRSPRVYYDYRTDRAIMLDAVLRTYSREHHTLIYSRAAEMRQVAEGQWTAQRARVSTSEFRTPHFSVGAQQVMVTQRPGPGREPAQRETHVDARHVTLRAGEAPFFYLPRVAGTIGDTPLRSIQVGHRDEDGARLQTTWNLFTLLGQERPHGVDAALQLDAFTKRGAGAGLRFRYGVAEGAGVADLYGMYDTGIDRTATGLRVDPQREWRGLTLWQHQTRLSPDWTFQGQLAWISDPTFISTWRERDFRAGREYETSAYIKHQLDNAAFTALAQQDLNTFISNDWLLASRHYQVDRLPELTYRRYGDSLFDDTFTHSGESRLSRVRLAFHRQTPARTGVPPGVFGAGAALDAPIEDLLLARGLRQTWVNRADTRHELSMPMTLGIFRVTPFVVGRVTAWDQDFQEFSPDADKLRFFAAAGVTMFTQFQHVSNDVRSRMLDLHRLRHIIEPRLTVWYGHSTVSRTDLPTYDQEVEAVGDGTSAQIGLRNIWQSQRGPAEMRRSVDVLTLDTVLALNSSDADRLSPTPRFFEHRPERSLFGDHVRASLVWLVSDNLTFGAESTYDLDERLFARAAFGASLRHSPLLTTFLEYRFIEASETELLDIGWYYRISPKYHVMLRPSWDFQLNEFRSVAVRVTRSFPDFDFIVQVVYDQIRDETTFGAMIGPRF